MFGHWQSTRTRRFVRLGMGFALAGTIVLVLVMAGLPWVASTRLVPGLARLYGARVEADRAIAGWSTARFEGLKFYEADDRHVAARIERLELDLTLWDLIRGALNPKSIVASGLHVYVRLDESGRLLSELPAITVTEGWPERMELTRSAVTVKQGQRVATVNELDANAVLSRNAYFAEGKVAGGEWGHWTLRATMDTELSNTSLAAETSNLSLTPTKLASLPVVGEALTSEVALEGAFGVQVAMELRAPSYVPSIQATVKTADATVGALATRLQITDAAFEARIDDSVADIHMAHGRVGGGEASLGGRIDFSQDPIRSSLDVRLASVHAEALTDQLPPSEVTEGTLSGAAKLDVGLGRNGEISVAGAGEATIEDAKVGGVPVGPIQLQVVQPNPAGAQPGGAPAAEISTRLQLRDAPLSQLLEALNVKGLEASSVKGVVSTEAEVHIPLATIGDAATYRVQGIVTSGNLSAFGMSVAHVKTDVKLSQGLLRVEPFSARLLGEPTEPEGTMSGSFTAQLVPAGEAKVDLTVTEAPASVVGSLLGLTDKPLGSVEVALNAAAPAEKLSDLPSWRGTGQARARSITLRGHVIDDVNVGVEAAAGAVHMRRAVASLAGTQLTSSGELRLAAPYAFEVKFEVPQGDLAKIAALVDEATPPALSGQVTGSGSLRGTLNPLNWSGSGELSAPDAQVGPIQLTSASVKFALNQEALQMTEARASLLGGELTARGRVPLQGEDEPHVAGSFENIHVERMAQELAGFWLQPLGNVSGQFSLAGRRLEDMRGHIDWNSSDKRKSEYLSQARGSVTVNRGKVQYDGVAQLFDGQASARGEARLSSSGVVQWEQGHVAIRQASLARAASALIASQQLPIEGALNLMLEISPAMDEPGPTGTGRMEIANLRWNRRPIAPLLESDVLLRQGQLRLPQISGNVAGGTLSAAVTVSLRPNESGEFDVRFNDLMASEVLAPWPELARQVDGSLDANFRGRLGRRVTGGGAVGASRLTVAGVEVQGLRLPVQFRYSTVNGWGEARVLESTFAAAHGRVTANAVLTYHRVLTLQAKTRLANVHLSGLTASGGSYLGAGRVSGGADFSSANLRSIDDLTSSFDLTLAQAQARQLPVLSSLSRYILPLNSSTGSFDRGELQGTLARGVARIQRFTLTGSDTRMMADGTITANGRLNLNVIARTGGSPLGRGVVRSVVLPILEAQVVPWSLLTRANQVLADRVVFLRVGGTVRSPAVQVQPAPQLGYEATRFFLLGALPAAP